jgi:RHS repeat-associated protein
MNTSNLKTANIYGSGLIGRVDLSGGATGGYYERLYYVKDHLGSIRVGISSVTTTNNNTTYACDYYPFGETIREYTAGTNKYKFTEKERDAETSYDYFGARYYNNKLGVWLSYDPMGGKYPGLSGYVYVRNNPLLRIDPDGLTDIKIEIKRIQETKKSTIGELKISNNNNSKQVNGVTLELPWKNNEKKISRIKSGEYAAKLGKSGNDALNKYGGVIRLEDKDNRDGILIHAGNEPQNTHGCILVGSEVAGDDKISGSGIKLTEILKYVSDIIEQDKKNKEKTTITVIVTDEESNKKESTEKEKK